MPCEVYRKKKFQQNSVAIINQANDIIQEYEAQGFSLTLRQLYYQFVARGLLPNTQASYNRLGSIINDARLAGLIDWLAIEDRTRFMRDLSHWKSPGQMVGDCARQFRLDKWAGQDYRPEVWIEKDALVGVVEQVCQEFDVPFFSCRGYVSQSAMWRAGQRVLKWMDDDQIMVVLHFGDHDPSGIDMSRDIRDRLELLGGLAGRNVKRIALTMDQVNEYRPPPNPAKITDSRSADYIEKYGGFSWELDALEPSVLANMVADEISALRNHELWDELVEQEKVHRITLSKVASDLEEDK